MNRSSGRVRVTGRVRVRAWDVVSRAVEEGIAYGYRRAHKHTDKPTEDAIRTEIETAVMNSLSEVLVFEEPA